MNAPLPRLRLDGATLLAQVRQPGDLGRDPAGSAEVVLAVVQGRLAATGGQP